MTTLSNPYHSPATVIQQYLRSEGLGVDAASTSSWKIFVGSMPDTDDENLDNAICVYDTGGVIDGRCMCDGQVYQHPGTSLRIRSRSYDLGYRKSKDILDNLSEASRKIVIIGSVEYLFQSFTPTTGVIPLGEVENRGRKSFSLNGLLSISQI